MVQYYSYMYPRRSHVLLTMGEAANGPEGRAILWNDNIEETFQEFHFMVSAETLLNYPDWKIPFTV